MAIAVRGFPVTADPSWKQPNAGGVGVSRPHTLASPLTGREREVLSLVAEGCSNKAIAGQLGISERTVKSHLTYIMAKLRVSDRTHAVVTAIRLGLLDI